MEPLIAKTFLKPITDETELKFNEPKALCGSTRKSSSNHTLIKAIAELTSETLAINIYPDLTKLPHFNPDIDNDDVPGQVTHFRSALRAAEGVIICTPEYAIGVPGTLKNAIDWTVSSMEFSNKPVALITGALLGEKAHQSLLGTLLIIEARMTDRTQLLISSIKSKLNAKGGIADVLLLDRVNALTLSLISIIDNDTEDFLAAPILMNSDR